MSITTVLTRGRWMTETQAVVHRVFRFSASRLMMHIAMSGNAGFQNRTTHFYGYPAGQPVEASDIKQSYNLFKICG